ncbi:MAG TPA: ankyrin repeat domain-containing protein [Planctomycetaceae bacterium]
MSDSQLSSGRQWPHWPNFNQFQRQAKELLKAYRAGDANAVADVAQHEPVPDPAAFALHDAQRVLARSYGFTNWQKLKSYVQTIENYRQPLKPKSDDDANKFLRLACITYFDGDHPARRERARQLLAQNPDIAKANIYTAAAVGDVAAVAELLTKNSDVRAKGGPFDWEPLLYAAYSRLDSAAEEHSTLQVARLLIEHGADPNAGFLWDWGGQFPCLCTALTGVLGLGETDVHRIDGPLYQPPHQDCFEFARLLLEAGADPNDNQGLYNRMQYPDDKHLKLLLEYGLGKDQNGPWFQRFFQFWPHVDNRSPADILSYQLLYAVKVNYFDRVKLLVENGADVNRASQYPAGARPPYAAAVYHGNQEIADYLVTKGAKRIALSTADAFAAACNRADADRARELVTRDPSLLNNPGELLILAAEEGRADSLRLLVELGFDVNGQADRPSPLHYAALAGQRNAVELLVELGADVHARDPHYGGTPLSAANYKNQRDVVEYLLQFAPIGDAVRFGGLDRVRTLLRQNPECVNVRDEEGRTPLHYLGKETQHGEEIIELLIEHAADVNAKDNEGRTPVDQILQNGREDLADVLRRHGGHSA